MAYGTGGRRRSSAMPPPVPHRAGSIRAWFWAFVACAALGCAAFWLTREPEQKAGLKDLAADKVNRLLARTPLAGMGDIIRETAPPPPPHEHPHYRYDEPGTLSGSSVRGGVGEAPVGGEAGADRPRVYFSADYARPAREDQRVRPGNVSSLAQWLCAGFTPGPDGGRLAVSVRGLNNSGGAKLISQAEDGRAALLRYAFNPAMIDGLYRLYIDRFMDDLNRAAKTRGFTPAENRQFHIALAGQAFALARALEAVADEPELSGELAQLDALSRQATEINSQLAATVAELNGMKKAGEPPSQLETANTRVQDLAARYRRALAEEESARNALLAQLRRNAGQGMDDDSLLYLASWVERRLNMDREASAAVKIAARSMRDLARRCAESGG